MIQTFVGPSAGEANWDQMAHCCFVDDGNDGFDNDLGDNYDDCVLSIILVVTSCECHQCSVNFSFPTFDIKYDNRE